MNNLVIAMWVLAGHSVPPTVYVSPDGSDLNPGTRAKPLRSLEAAAKRHVPVVEMATGTYYLPKTLVLGVKNSGTTFAAARGATVTISGGTELRLAWKPYRDGIMQARVPEGVSTDQLFINDQRQTMARYPNEDLSQRILHGYAKDAISPERAQRWADPTGGFLHAMHVAMWGDYHYRITGKDKVGKVTYEGGWQNNRQMGMHPEYRFVENIFEELDAPGEWFLNGKTHTLYYYPRDGVDLSKARVEVVRLKHLIELRGAKDVHFKGVRFTQSQRTFMENREPLLRSDWTTYRGGAILAEGTEGCSIEDSFLDQLGGNAIFVSGRNRGFRVVGCRIEEIGGNGVAFVGLPKAVRSPLFEYEQRQKLADIDKVPGPKTDDYPMDCSVEDCLITRTGRVEKQTAPVQIEMARRIRVRHCSIYDVPRAGINVGDGCWGGHVIEFNDVFDTVKETGDHGSFNSWGRDRYWGLLDVDPNKIQDSLPFLDVIETIVIRNNRFRCDHGWDIDLDDGSSNYLIENNLCLNGGIKNREGFRRVVQNNVMVANSFHPHVWFVGSQDVFRHNIVCTEYQPIQVPKPWGAEVDWNYYHRPALLSAVPATVLQEQSGRDAHSLMGRAAFVAPASGDYRVRPDSEALAIGFKNFPMDQFGVSRASLRAIAKRPELPAQATAKVPIDQEPGKVKWLGCQIKKVDTDGEVSATGLPGRVGILLVDVPVGSLGHRFGLRTLDVIRAIDGKETQDVDRFLASTKGIVKLSVWRGQKFVEVIVRLP